MRNSSISPSPSSVHLSCGLVITWRDAVSSPKTGWFRILPSHSACGSLAQLPTTEKWKCSCWVLDYVPAALRWYKQDLIWTGLVEYGKQSRKSGENRKWLPSVPQEWSHAKRCCEPFFWGLQILFAFLSQAATAKPSGKKPKQNDHLLFTETVSSIISIRKTKNQDKWSGNLVGIFWNGNEVVIYSYSLCS